MSLFTGTVQQVAALPFVCIDHDFEVLLITSRDSGHWILPKGWPSHGRSHVETARREAAEEAGVIGVFGEEIVGSYSYTKNMDVGYRVPCTVFVFPLLVEQQNLSWPEETERMLRWCRLDEAADLATNRGLARLFSSLSLSNGEPLRAAMAAMETESTELALDVVS